MLKRFVKTLAVALAIVVVLYAAMAGYMRWQLEPVTDPSDYEHVLAKRWHESRLVSHFPRRLPDGANSVQFHFRPGFMQGKPSIELRYRASHEHIVQLAERHRPAAKLIVRGDEALSDSNRDSDSLPRRHFVTVARGEIPQGRATALLPPGFDIMVLYPRAAVMGVEGSHHGESAGMAVSMQRDEVIFWAELW